MSDIGQVERITQNRIVRLFKNDLGYRYLGNLQDLKNKNIREQDLKAWLKKRGISDGLIQKTFRKLDSASALGEGRKLYYANKDVYELLRYGIKDKDGQGEQKQTVWLIDWQNPEANDFAVAEEVSVQGENKKRPDVVLYINGIALGVIELKRSTVSLTEGIRQNLDNQKKDFIRDFFTTMQLVMAGNDSQGLRYGTIETPEKYYLEWKEELENPYKYRLDFHLSLMCNKKRFLQLIHDFIVFDAGVKKACRHNQFFGIEAAKQRVAQREGGIIWHTQGSGKSLTMVWLAKWIRENIINSRVLIVTDRTELDEQIEKVFSGVEETIYRTRSGTDLIHTLNTVNPSLICSLVHKFGRHIEDEEDNTESADEFIEEMKRALPHNFKAKGDLFIFVDECHRTQSGKLHGAMKQILPEAMVIGFTGTPLMKKDKKKSIEVFGSYIHTYKFNEAVEDGVVLDIRYEARDIDQRVKSPKKVDEWFEAKTRKLSDLGKTLLKQKWGTMQKVLSSRSRQEQIVADILMDMDTRPRLMDGRGNAMLVCSSVYQACTAYKLFNETDLKGKVAIVTSYLPTAASIKGEESGAGLTEKLAKYDIYRQMLADYFEKPADQVGSLVDEFEKQVKEKFINEPGQMRLLIVVDKLLTGFDAPSATYLYIDKTMADHNLFQAICRVNRLDTDDKEYGYIVDYKDLFKSIDKTIKDYTSEALDGYDKEDVDGLLKDRIQAARLDLDTALEIVKALCEPVPAPRLRQDYLHYFCGESGLNSEEIKEKEALRLSLYKAINKFLRSYANIASEMTDAGYTDHEVQSIEEDVKFFENLSKEIKAYSGDAVDMKVYEPAMRQLLDMYIEAESSEEVIKFEEFGLIDLILRGDDAFNGVPDSIRRNPESMAEAIENNVRKKIVEENPLNPAYYDQMSVLLDEIIELRRKKAIEYKQYLEKIRDITRKVTQPTGRPNYPEVINTSGKQALYDNFGKDIELTVKIDLAIQSNKLAAWVGDHAKEKILLRGLSQALGTNNRDVLIAYIELAKLHQEYH
ncbi:type I restriction endonuclease subunit R [Acinetobacter lactucae]|uniref:Type I restriction enzyme endonuclease subunit n=1 Tax=Acinetobacter lactucae TaxID=1785128 RepID=A0AB35K611_9GAMM|nr:HsdR family type I site-specific deoxyribonuclease [Acinetobacter lactucae]MDD9316200.1 HsdR family type I site-specific deoxyribonuclease [Acinetobacter lactucae]MDD9320355.1 HsdR family type I site-specific deoxyribonuclease [Acinetobacter lactucae]